MVLLREIRERNNITQNQLSVLSGIPQQTISAIESHKRTNPGVETLYPLAKALGCMIDDLYKYDESKNATAG